MDEVRIGVFICHCGSNIAGVVNIPEVVEFSRSLPGVAYVEDGKFICAADFQDRIKECLREHRLDRLVVAACTPRTHAYIFQRTCEEAGLNKYLFEFANIREQCSWVHKEVKEAATAKARDLIAMSVARARHLRPLEDLRLPVGRESLVIGGGIAGLTAALTLADMGFEVILVEKEPDPGGILRKLDCLFPQHARAEELLKPALERVSGHPRIKLYTGSRVTAVSGYLGNFEVRVAHNGGEGQFKVSTIIVATGLREAEPPFRGEGVVTQLELEEMLREGRLRPVRNVVMLNCVGSREEPRAYCCRLGCGISLKNARIIRERFPEAVVYILTQDIVLPGREHLYLLDALRDGGIRVIRYPQERRPEVTVRGGEKIVRVFDQLLGETLELRADLVVLTVGLEGAADNEELSRMLKVPLAPGNFLQEAHIKLRPLDFATDGIYLCGAVQFPKPAGSVVREAIGAAMRAAIPMYRGEFIADAVKAGVDPERCSGCGRCLEVCPYGAIRIEDSGALVIPALCWGCGSCAPTCPRDAISIQHFEDRQVLAAVDAALADNPAGKVLAFLCNWCSYAAADTAGVSRFQYSPAVRIIRVMCSGRVHPRFIYHALGRGAGMVLVAGCKFGDCHYLRGNLTCNERMRKLLEGLPLNAPCRSACPAGVNAQGYISLILQGKYREALRLVREAIPLPGICGRVCTHPCEGECERGKIDRPVSIRALKRFIADVGRDGEAPAVPITKAERVAVVGSGPAGLACAYDLIRRGYPVTVFEALPEAGGLLRYGIPEYRLPKDVLDDEIEYLRRLGVEIRTGTPVTSLDDLFRQGYRAVCLALGAGRSRALGVPGEELPGVYHALSFLRKVNSGERVEVGRRVAVIGGGNAAVDAARTALRLGAEEVTIVYRRTRDEMPAIPDEVAEAEREGVKFLWLAAPVRILSRDGRASGVECLRMEPGPPDESGRPSPVPIKGSEFTLEADDIIVAVGQRVDPDSLPPGLQLTGQGTVSVDPITLETGIPGVFAAGDVATGPADVITATALGKEAARSIALYLEGGDLRRGRRGQGRRRPRREAGRHPAGAGPLLEVEKRRGNFAEVERCFSEPEALAEARRCLHCGVCFECDDCRELLGVGLVDEEAGTVRIPEDRLRVEWISATEGEVFARLINELAERLERRAGGAGGKDAEV